MKKRSFVLAALLGAPLLLASGYVAANWAPDLPVEVLLPRWAPPPSAFVNIAGMSVHVRDEGPRQDPAPLLLLHGTSASLHTWQGWAEALRSERRVIRVDLPGFGLTGPAPDGNYKIERYVSFVLSTLDLLGVQRAVLGGNSFGGYVAWATAAAQPDRVKALLLVDSGGYAPAATSTPIGFRIARTPLLAPLVRSVLPRGLIESSVQNVYGDPSKVTPELVDLYYDLARRAGNRTALAERFRQTPGGDRVDQIAKVSVPTLILWGAEDRLIPPERAELFHRAIAGSQLVMFPGLGHVPHEEDPRATVAVARTFLAELR